MCEKEATYPYLIEKTVFDRRQVLEIEAELEEEIDALVPVFNSKYVRQKHNYDKTYVRKTPPSRSEMFRWLIAENGGSPVPMVRELNRSHKLKRFQFQMDPILDALLERTAEVSGMSRAECFRQLVYDALENL